MTIFEGIGAIVLMGLVGAIGMGGMYAYSYFSSGLKKIRLERVLKELFANHGEVVASMVSDIGQDYFIRAEYEGQTIEVREFNPMFSNKTEAEGPMNIFSYTYVSYPCIQEFEAIVIRKSHGRRMTYLSSQGIKPLEIPGTQVTRHFDIYTVDEERARQYFHGGDGAALIRCLEADTKSMYVAFIPATKRAGLVDRFVPPNASGIMYCRSGNSDGLRSMKHDLVSVLTLLFKGAEQTS